MEIRKAASAAPCGEPTPGQLEAINTLSRGALTAEDVYVFSVRLCDDQPDRDYERFDTYALPRLAELFRGKTGVTDHNWSAEKQVARIFDTEVVQEGGVTYLKAWCYCLRAEEALIAQIDGGIRKEVSVGCAMGRRTCSICGSPYGSCSHRKGQRYEAQVCLAVLSEPTDAYEFSFVAVPAQREAGVSKGFAEPKSEDQERLAASGLELVCETAPALTVTADARLLWRVFDNLFNNAAKYALPGTRVYLNTRIEGERAKVTMKNVSRERLDVAGEELTERFVRGDASRNSQTEGSGLGLSIAKSLAELQGGDFHVAVDGDLFKAELTLPTVAPTE